MRLLDFMLDPPGYCERHSVQWPSIIAGGLGSIIAVALPDLASDTPSWKHSGRTSAGSD
jgi:hypothetical protein